MHLLHIQHLTLHEFQPPTIPRYVVASHRWDASGEVSYRNFDLEIKTNRTAAYRKIRSFCRFIRINLPDFEWLWIDTACVDQSSTAQVGEAVNSMFRWYQNAEICLAYLADVTLSATSEDIASKLKGSEWFKRGWTLQELLAPRLVVLLSREWQVIGHKGSVAHAQATTLVNGPGPSLISILAHITSVPSEVLTCYEVSKEYKLEQKELWRRHRKTTRPEDLAYCMLGIFDVHIPLIYGEGEYNAMVRVYEAVDRKLTRTQHPDTRVYISADGTSLSEWALVQRGVKDPAQTPLNERASSWRHARTPNSGNNIALRPAIQLIELPRAKSNKYKYFLDGAGLSRHLVKRYFHSITEPSTDVTCTTLHGRNGYLIYGALLDDDILGELKRQSYDYGLSGRLDNLLHPGN